MKKSKMMMILFGATATVLSIIYLFAFTKGEFNKTFIVLKDTYGYEFAQKHNIEMTVLSDSNKKEYEKQIESYVYNNITDGIEIIDYEGISEQLIIPNTINGTKVVSIKENAFSKNTNLKRIVVGNNVKNIELKGLENITITCYNNSYCDNLEGVKTIKLPDSEASQYNFNEQVNEFEYNKIDSKIELTKYNGTSSTIIIPKTINGYKVEQINFEVSKEVEQIYVPENINKIDIQLNEVIYGAKFYASLVVIVLVFAIYAIVMFVVSNKKENDNFNNIPLYGVSSLYLIVMLYSAVFHASSNKTFFITSLTITFVYGVLALLLGISKKKIAKYDEEIKEAGSFIRNAVTIINELKDNDELKEELCKLEETIKYSDPVSSSATLSLEQQIIDKLKEVATVDKVKEIQKLVEKRNIVCKENK